MTAERTKEVRKLIEEIKRLYGRLAECLGDDERRSGIWDDVIAKQTAIAALMPRRLHSA